MKIGKEISVAGLIIICGVIVCVGHRPASTPRPAVSAVAPANRRAILLTAPRGRRRPADPAPNDEHFQDAGPAGVVAEARKLVGPRQVQPVAAGTPEVVDPDARQALGLVGIDPAAELYWVAAINDPTLPGEERRNLIEDLNEDGLIDPKHPQAEDFPVLARRLELLDALSFTPMDQVNSEAFAEARKDLVDLLAGEPAP